MATHETCRWAKELDQRAAFYLFRILTQTERLRLGFILDWSGKIPRLFNE
jgi:hypothetical protein